MAFPCTPESCSEHPLRLGLTGSVLGVTAVVSPVPPLTEDRIAGQARWIWTPLVVVPFAIITFIWQQHHRATGAGTQLLPFPFFRVRSLFSGLLIQILAPIGHGDFAFTLLFHMQAAFHFTSSVAGLILLPTTIGSILGTPVVMLLMKKIGRWSVCLGGVMQVAASIQVMIILERTGMTLNGQSLLPPFALVGVGMTVLIVPQTSIILAETPTTEVGTTSGTLTTFGQAGMVFGIVLSGTAYFGTTGDNGQNVTTGPWVIVIVYTVSGLAALTTPIRSSQKQPSPDPSGPG